MDGRLLTLLLTVAPCLVGAQDINYAYDKAGNRTERMVYLPSKTPSDEDSKPEFTELLAGKTLRISPNPTKGLVKVEVFGLGENESCELSLSSYSGRLIAVKKVSSAYTEFDLSSQSKGLYILVLRVGDRKTSWKIIKE